MTARPIVKMMILIRERILGIKSIFTMWITIMEKFKKMASMSITFLRPRLSPKYCRIWTRTPRAPSNVTSSWPLSQGSARCSRISTTVGVRAQQLGPYSVFPQVVRVSHQSGQSHKGVKVAKLHAVWLCVIHECLLTNIQHLRIQQTGKNTSAQIIISHRLAWRYTARQA